MIGCSTWSDNDFSEAQHSNYVGWRKVDGRARLVAVRPALRGAADEGGAGAVTVRSDAGRTPLVCTTCGSESPAGARFCMQFDERLRDELLADVKAIAPILVAFSTATPSRSWRG